jgi:hypothetical protein
MADPKPPITKKLKDVTWEDVAGLSVPSSDFIGKTSMDNRPIFDDKWRQDTLNNWKQKLLRRFPNAMEFNIVIDRNAPMWFNKVKIVYIFSFKFSIFNNIEDSLLA